MKNITLLCLFLTCHFLTTAQIYVDQSGFVRYQQPSPQVIHDTVVKTVTVKDTVYYCPPVTQPPTTPPVVVQPVDAYTLVYSSGYNKMSDLTTDNAQYGNGTISTSIKTEGAGSFLAIPQGNLSNGYRSEDQFTDGSKDIPMKEGAVEYDVRYEYMTSNNGHSVQWHPFGQRDPAALALWHKNGTLVLGRDIGASTNGFKPTLNKWYRFRIEFNFDNANGYARWYIDGKLQHEIKGLPVSSGGGQYFKLGANLFNDANDAKSRIYYDNLKIYQKK